MCVGCTWVEKRSEIASGCNPLWEWEEITSSSRQTQPSHSFIKKPQLSSHCLLTASTTAVDLLLLTQLRFGSSHPSGRDGKQILSLTSFLRSWKRLPGKFSWEKCIDQVSVQQEKSSVAMSSTGTGAGKCCERDLYLCSRPREYKRDFTGQSFLRTLQSSGSPVTHYKIPSCAEFEGAEAMIQDSHSLPSPPNTHTIFPSSELSKNKMLQEAIIIHWAVRPSGWIS